jgi:hypothetical protein
MREARPVKPPLQLQVAHPPDWLPEAHTSADLGAFISLGSREPRRRAAVHEPSPWPMAILLTE